jgi:branched-chain amino acid transport system permease protein
MLTLAFAQMGYFAMLAWKDVTGGENGFSGLPRTFSLFGLPIASALSFYLLSAGAFLVAFLAVQRINASPFGTVMTAIRENEARSEALGYDVRLYKIVALAISGGIAGLSGALHAAFLGFVPPNNIELEMSQRILVMAIIGGVGSPAGALVGSGFYTLVSELLSELWARWLALIALLLIAIVLFLPGGLWSIGARLARRRADA